MYQFYYAQKPADFVRKECKLNIRDHFRITAVRPAMWEEHCLECSVPYCFETCMHYQARSDGRCKRFTNGLLTFPEEKACCGQGVRVKFRKWGNMMTHLFPAMLTEADYGRLWKNNERYGMLLQGLQKSFLSPKYRWKSIRALEYLRRRKLQRLTGLDNRADALLFHCYSYSEESYRLILEVAYDRIPAYKTAITVNPGENLAVISDMTPACAKAGSMIRLYPELDMEAELDILWCDFVQGTPVAAEKPADKVKCVVWDLDGTLWDGVLIETEDPDSLCLKPGIRELMEQLDQRGILQSVASKNEYAPTMAVLEKLGISDYFLYPQIHWNPKSGSLEQIAKDLNIGIDSFAFVDDTPFERQQVSAVWPQVRVYDAAEAGALLSRPEFDVPVTAESRTRRSMYRSEEKRNALMASGTADFVEFLKKCNLKMRVFTPETEDELLRCYELLIRTNQLNMAGKKYTRQEFEEILRRPGHRNYAFSCGDDFGEYGIVGFAQYRVEADSLVFAEFALSCRVAGKFVESAFFAHCLEKEQAKRGDFTVIKTKKNGLLRRTLEQIGFAAREETDTAVAYTFDEDLKYHTIVKVQ